MNRVTINIHLRLALPSRISSAERDQIMAMLATKETCDAVTRKDAASAIHSPLLTLNCYEQACDISLRISPDTRRSSARPAATPTTPS